MFLLQARAKLELREEATEADALDVLEIMKNSLIDIFTDDVGIMDTTRSQNGTGMSTKNQASRQVVFQQVVSFIFSCKVKWGRSEHRTYSD